MTINFFFFTKFPNINILHFNSHARNDNNIPNNHTYTHSRTPQKNIHIWKP
jgi:hypothetical protein